MEMQVEKLDGEMTRKHITTAIDFDTRSRANRSQTERSPALHIAHH